MFFLMWHRHETSVLKQKTSIIMIDAQIKIHIVIILAMVNTAVCSWRQSLCPLSVVSGLIFISLVVHEDMKVWRTLHRNYTLQTLPYFDQGFKNLKPVVLSMSLQIVRSQNIFISSPNVSLNIIFLCTKQNWIMHQAFRIQTFFMSGWF